LQEVGRLPGRLRIALATASWNGSPVDPECSAAARAAAALCEGLGHRVEEARPPIDGQVWPAIRVIIGANVCATLEARAKALDRTLGSDDVERFTWARTVDARNYSATDYVNAIGVTHRVGRVVARFFADHDLILSPTMCQPPFPLGVLDLMSEDDEAYIAALQASVGFTSLFNFTGNPAMSLPLAWSEGGLPIGVQFAASFGDEATLFRLAAQLEQAQPWVDRRPTLAS
jgi:amidase/6-aminohexanoate-cyclic-dimer hydrolase